MEKQFRAPKISIIIPTYKPGSYLYECLDALMNQTLDKDLFEIILVLNGSREPYWNTLSKYVTQYRNVNLLYENKAGVSFARNKGLDVSRGEYICFIDDDDIVSSNYLSSLLEKANKYTLVVSDVKNFTESVLQYSDDYISKAYRKFKRHCTENVFALRGFLSVVWCKMIPQNIIGNNRFNSKIAIGEDTLFMFTISRNIQKIELADGAIYYRRCRWESASRKKRTMAFTIKNSVTQLFAYFRIYCRHPFQYNFFLFLSRITASVIHKNRLISLKRKLLH